MIEQTEKRSKERKKNLYVLRSMIKQNVRFKYRNSTLGVFWTVLRPVLEMLVMWMVFSQLFGRNDPTYHLYLLSGTIAFGVMSEATNSSLGSIVHSAGLLKSTKRNTRSYRCRARCPRWSTSRSRARRCSAS